MQEWLILAQQQPPPDPGILPSAANGAITGAISGAIAGVLVWLGLKLYRTFSRK